VSDVHIRAVVPAGDGTWRVLVPGCRRASALEDSLEDAEERGREILRNLGGGELHVHGVDGAVLATYPVPAPASMPASRTYRAPRGTYGRG
jgi:hypothetical protein